MRKLVVLTVLVLALSLIVWTQFVTSVSANVIPANVNINPDALLLKEGGHGNWITANIGLPEGYDIDGINVSSVTLEVMGAHVPVSMYETQGNKLMVKFDRSLVISLLWPMTGHMSPHAKQEVTLEVAGTLLDGNAFRGSDTIRVFFTQP